ncbi:DedA family protein [Ferrimonas marina]|uniref:Membrane protein DedA, SNARE-associated domain n=1 Tax=Ferrimonas marina TaxID=299255 RepID=A0A1M5MRU1_9GAMM|nr:DedA family protein [Ferrimonas marina]SHG80160.1 membrane protein DedA, SNARE-associated domain [Ferrimonas marina]
MTELFQAIWHQDLLFLQSYNRLWLLVFCLGLILFLESAFVFLPLPGDSLVIFAGALVGLGVLDPYVSLLIVPAVATLGACLAYEQGRWLQQRPGRWNIERLLPEGTLERASALFERHGILALFVARFIPFVRVLVPMMMGASQLSRGRFALVSFISAFCWAASLGLFGRFVVNTPFYAQYGDEIARAALVIPLVLFVAASVAVVVRLVRKRACNKKTCLVSRTSKVPAKSDSKGTMGRCTAQD